MIVLFIVVIIIAGLGTLILAGAAVVMSIIAGLRKNPEESS